MKWKYIDDTIHCKGYLSILMVISASLLHNCSKGDYVPNKFIL